MLVDDGLTFREIVMKDPLPKGAIQQSVIEFLKGRQDAAVYGAMAVNAYVDERRMTEDVGIVSSRARELAEELRLHLGAQFHIAVRVRVRAWRYWLSTLSSAQAQESTFGRCAGRRRATGVAVDRRRAGRHARGGNCRQSHLLCAPKREAEVLHRSTRPGSLAAPISGTQDGARNRNREIRVAACR